MKCAQEATVTLSIGASDIVSHAVKHTRIIFKLAKFYARADKYG